jgi:catechol 2,3-dioxygenase-like lactoylglutathione lyase family enzyme
MTDAEQAIPIFRSFDEAATKAFYIDFLGFEIEFEHRFDPDAPLFLRIRLGKCILFLSEHHGDATPGGSARIDVPDVHAYCEALNEKNYKHARPGVQSQEWGYDDMTIADPSGNRLIFCTKSR